MSEISQDWINYRGEVIHNIWYLLKTSNDKKRFFAYIDDVSKKLIKDWGFMAIDIISDENSRKGVVCFDPSGVEILREIPKPKGWRYLFVRESLKYGKRDN